MTLDLHKDNLILCECSLGARHPLSQGCMVAAKDAEVTEKAQTASMKAKKSRVEMVICCGGDAKVLSPSTSAGVVVLGAGGF